MHLSVKHSQLIEDAEIPVNPTQSPADILVLSFTDSDLACMAEAGRDNPNIRLTSIAALTHPLSIDLYIEQVAAHAKIILVRLLGGYERWKYGISELHKLAVAKNTKLIIVSGCTKDPRLYQFSTVPKELTIAIENCLFQGGGENARRVLTALTSGEAPSAELIENGKLYKVVLPARAGIHAAKQATIIFYRAHFLAADTAPIDALLGALSERGIAARAFMVASLKDEKSFTALKQEVQQNPPDIILDATAFSAGNGAHPLAFCNVPILQVALAGISRDDWKNLPRGLTTTDMAMQVVLPEADGRIFTRAISFKEQSGENKNLEFTRLSHCPEKSRIDFVAELAANWVNLRKKENKDKKIAIIMSDYPERGGRKGYAVGLDAPASAREILKMLETEGYIVTTSNDGIWKDLELIQPPQQVRGDKYNIENYKARFAALPQENQQKMLEIWGKIPEDGFSLPMQKCGNALIAFQPDRGSLSDKKTGYHDSTTPPRHEYLAFYWWLRDEAKIDAIIHLGTHGNLEWLPAKTAALSESCWPEIVLGATPIIYPYIVTDAGEAAQAKRRISAVTISHLPPPMNDVRLSPELAELERLVDEYSSADGLDARRMKHLRDEIIFRAKKSGLSFAGSDDASIMSTLEANLCDIKEQRIGDGLHIFGTSADNIESAANERKNLLVALSGGFITPTVGGSPARARADIFPTGRNLIGVDPRTIPTKTASIIGGHAAAEFIRRYTQDNGEYPKNVMMDMWGAASLRTGGDDIAHAFALMGVNIVWDESTQRVCGFEIIPDAEMQWPRVDVSLRISGLFRDMFPNLILLFDDAVKKIAELQGKPANFRIFGNAWGTYGTGALELIDNKNWKTRNDLGDAYLKASHFAYGRAADGALASEELKQIVSRSDALIHVQDMREVDILSGADYAGSEGGFAAAAGILGGSPKLYHIDSSNPERIKARTLAEEISLTLNARALNPDWINGQMRHGYAGGAEIANVVDNLFAFAATSDTVSPEQFQAVADAYLHDEKVYSFLEQNNPEALKAIKTRLQEAIIRGLWLPLRNSTNLVLETSENSAIL